MSKRGFLMSGNLKVLWLLAALLAGGMTLTACGGSDSDDDDDIVDTGGGGGGSGGGGGGGNSSACTATSGTAYDVCVRRTKLGIPHVAATRNGDFASVGYGLGYAFAEDNMCSLLNDIVTIRGERALFFGRDGTYTIPANSSTANNVNSDFFWRSLIDTAAIDRFKAAAVADARNATVGFKDGFNRYVNEIKAGQHPGRHAACRSAAWLRPLEEADMYRRYIRLGVLASSSVFVTEVGSAQPPAGLPVASAAPSIARKRAALKADPGALAAFLPSNKDHFGSNMYALGSEATGGAPMVFGNPHFPWQGTERLYISHLTIPGRGDIMGSSLYGVPAILIGFNRNFAWSHTVSTAYRFSLYELTLNPTNPTQYLYDGAFRDMIAVPLTIQVKEADNSITEQSRTLYKSHYGPMMVLEASGVPVLGWNNLKAYSLRDANFENTRLINQFFAWNTAQSMTEFKSLHKSILGVPWVNTVAAGPGSKAYYGDVTVVPHVTDEQIQTCQAIPLHQAIQLLVPGLPLLDGSRSACEWGTDSDAPVPGIFGAANLPTLERDDWVHNCNDSYWLTNPAAPITGFNRIIGDEGTERSLRTRLCIQQVQRHLGHTDTFNADTSNHFDRSNDKRFNLVELQETVLSSRIHSAELAQGTVLSTICPLGNVLTTSGPVNVAPACAVLAGWKQRDEIDSVGGHIWREFWRGLSGNPLGLPLGPQLPISALWTTQFSASDPVNTPRGLNVANPQVQMALGDAVNRVQASGFALDAPLGTMQHSGVAGNANIPIFGGEGHEGAFTIMSAGSLDSDGYPVTYGNSYIQTVTWDANTPSGANPIAEGFITYSQSTDPASPHFTDYTREYSAKRWNRFPFTDAEISAGQVGNTLHLTTTAP